MKKTLLFIILIFSFVEMSGQLKAVEKQQLSTTLLKRINTHREKEGHLKLKRNPDLIKAAKIQCTYLTKAGKLSHNNPNPDLKTPKKRVEKFSKSFVAFGENILYSKPTNIPLSKTAINKLAYDMFNSWKKSPGHYANMISDVYSHSDLTFGYDVKTRRVYAVHVFGKKGYIIPNQLSDNAFGIIKTDEYCNTLLGGKQNILANMGNAISIEGDEVVLRYHNKESLKRVLVTREQMICGANNRFDASEIYDGVLLKPIYRDEFFFKNKAEGDYRIVVSLGKIPKNLKEKELSPNMVFIKQGMKCSYITPTSMPSGHYNLKKIEPILHIPDTKLKTVGIKSVTELLFEFETGKSTASNSPKLSKDTGDLFAVDIQSYTSVDGNTKFNADLHLKRAEFIKKYVSKKIDVSKAKITIDAKENWDLLDYQLERLGLEDVRKFSKPKIRAYVNKEANGRLFYSLQDQRRSSAILYKKGTWDKNDKNHIYSNLLNGLIDNDMPLANRALVEIYKDTTNSIFLEENFIMNRLFHKPELVQNVAALMLKDIHGYSLDNVVFFVRTWLAKANQLSKEAQKNVLNLYTITGRRMLSNWDLSAFNLKKIMHPEKVEPLFKSYASEAIVNPLFLNFHMTRIRFYGQINEYEKTDESFDFITKYYKSQALTIKDDIALSLFFNSWSAYYNTNELLFKSYLNDRLNEQSTFILIQTIMGYPYHNNGETIKKELILALHEKAISYNKKKWCTWIDIDFQNLRDDSIKNLYCKSCNKL